MDPDLSRLDDYLDAAGLDGYLLDAAGDVSDQRYLSGFDAPDPFVSLYTPAETVLLVSSLEYGRARNDSRADAVERTVDYDYSERVAELGPTAGRARVVADFLDAHGVDGVAAPARFPLATADGVREAGVAVDVETEAVVEEIRAVKTDAEVDAVRRAQRANETALAAAERLLAESERGTHPDHEGAVVLHGGDPLTSERVRTEIEVTLLELGCGLEETIVACGADAADPHERGSGPLRPDEPVVVDVFPRERASDYHADMTRTFVVGDPGDDLRRRHEVTVEALDAALGAVEPGATGAAVHDAACDVYEDAGYPTLRSDPETETGFIHSTGHGVGLDVHELPRLAPDGGELEAGHVVTVEPGLYDPAVGGVRVEDLVVVTDDGHENLTDYHRDLVV